MLIGAIIIALIGGGFIFYFAFQTPNKPGTESGTGGTPPSPYTGNSISTQSLVGETNGSSAILPKFIADPNKFLDSTKKLSYDERQRLSLFIGNMAGTIQTYGYKDYADVLALSDYFTTNGQAALQAYIEQLDKTTTQGYRQYAVADSTAQMSLFYNPNTQKYTISVYTLVYNLSDPNNSKASGHQVIDFELVQNGKNWKFNNVSLYSK